MNIEQLIIFLIKLPTKNFKTYKNFLKVYFLIEHFISFRSSHIISATILSNLQPPQSSSISISINKDSVLPSHKGCIEASWASGKFARLTGASQRRSFVRNFQEWKRLHWLSSHFSSAFCEALDANYWIDLEFCNKKLPLDPIHPTRLSYFYFIQKHCRPCSRVMLD